MYSGWKGVVLSVAGVCRLILIFVLGMGWAPRIADAASGGVASVTVTDGGNGYTAADMGAAVTFSGGGGSGGAGNIFGIDALSEVTAVGVPNPGRGHTPAPTFTIPRPMGNGGGTG